MTQMNQTRYATTRSQYAHHPLLPLYELLMNISTSQEFDTRRGEILAAIDLAAPVLKRDRTAELRLQAKDTYLKRSGSPTTPERMAYYLETAMKETLALANPPAKSGARSVPSWRRASLPEGSVSQTSVPIKTMTFRQLRDSLPTVISIPTIGGRTDIKINNPSYGHLMVVNSQGKSYQVSEADWNNACVIRSRNPQDPWKSKHYTGINAYTSYGLNYAAAILREIEENDLVERDDLVETLPLCRDTW